MLSNNVFTFIILISVVLCDVPHVDEKNAKILDYVVENVDPRKYYFRFETTNGIYREESGEIVKSESNEEILIVHGTYSYVGPDNVLYIVKYTSDDKGYRVEDVGKGPQLQAAPAFKNRISGNAIKSLQGGGIG